MALASMYTEPQSLAGPGTWAADKGHLFAHKTMRFGTKVEFRYRGRTAIGVCLARGPYVGGRVFDLGPGVAERLRFDGVGYVRWRCVR